MPNFEIEGYQFCIYCNTFRTYDKFFSNSDTCKSCEEEISAIEDSQHEANLERMEFERSELLIIENERTQ